MSDTPMASFQVLETDKRLSESKLWSMLEDFYCTAGIEAWDQIPYYPTSNAFIGDIYAEMILAFLKDIHPHLVPGEPVYIVEMATGSGCFSHFCLNALREKLAFFKDLQTIPLCYVMTDFTENNVLSWEKNPKLAPFIEAGMLDFGVFRPEDQDTIALRRSGKVLSGDTVKNPMIAIANYFFDSIRQDYFQVKQGELREALISLSHPDTEGPLQFDRLLKTDRFVPVTEPRYTDARLNTLLGQYQAEFDEASFLFPVGAFRCLNNLERMANGQVMLLSSDKGFNRPDYVEGLWESPFTPHSGIFSYMVNYHALGRYFENQGGQAHHTQENYTMVTLVGLSPMSFASHFEETRYVIAEHLQKRSPIKNFFALKNLLQQTEPPPETEAKELYRMAMACIQLANCDPFYFQMMGEHLLKAVQALGVENLEDDLPELLRRVETHLYDSTVGLKEACYWLRTLYYELDELDKCLERNDMMLARFGPERNVFYYRAAIHEIRGNYPEAMSAYRQALEVDPDYDLAQSGIARMQPKLAAEPQ